MSTPAHMACRACGRQAAHSELRCGACRGSLEFRPSLGTQLTIDPTAPGVWRYASMLPALESSSAVSLAEGRTPLHESRSRGDRLVFKDETRNPTGSHKDRALALALTHASTIDARASIVVSSGSTGISHSAYAARAGIKSIVLVSEDTPPQRLAPLIVLGSEVICVNASVDELISFTEATAPDHGLYLSATCRSSNPYQAEGPRTIAFELFEELGHSPDWIVVPVGGGGTIAGIWRGFCDLRELGLIATLPRLLASVPQTHDILKHAQSSPDRSLDELADELGDRTATVQAKTAHVRPHDGEEALAAVRESGGDIITVTDADALVAQATFGADEGIYLEPSSTAAISAYERALKTGLIGPEQQVAVLLSGSGFRETFVIAEQVTSTPRRIEINQLTETLNAFGG